MMEEGGVVPIPVASCEEYHLLQRLIGSVVDCFIDKLKFFNKRRFGIVLG